MSLPRTLLGRTSLEASRLALSARSMTAAGPKGLKLTPEDVERAFHEHGVNTFLVSPGMKELTEGLRRLSAAGHRDELILIGGTALPFGWSLGGSIKRTHLEAVAEAAGAGQGAGDRSIQPQAEAGRRAGAGV